MAVTLKPSGIQRQEGTAYCSEGILVVQDVHGRAEGGGSESCKEYSSTRVRGGGGSMSGLLQASSGGGTRLDEVLHGVVRPHSVVLVIVVFAGINGCLLFALFLRFRR